MATSSPLTRPRPELDGDGGGEGPRGPSRLHELAARVEELGWLDGPVNVADRLLPDAVRQGPVRDVLGGRWLGHAAHPMLTDFPLGMWMSASMLDLLPGDHRAASQRLLAGGLLGALPTVVTGWSDWSTADRPRRRIGIVHAVTNAAAALLYARSLAARRADRHGAGVALGIAGGLTAVVGGFLGGHLATDRGVSVHSSADVNR